VVSAEQNLKWAWICSTNSRLFHVEMAPLSERIRRRRDLIVSQSSDAVRAKALERMRVIEGLIGCSAGTSTVRDEKESRDFKKGKKGRVLFLSGLT